MPRRDRELARTTRRRLTALTSPARAGAAPDAGPRFAQGASAVTGWVPDASRTAPSWPPPPATGPPSATPLTHLDPPVATPPPAGPPPAALPGPPAAPPRPGAAAEPADVPVPRTTTALRIAAQGYVDAHGDPTTRTPTRRRRVRWAVPWRLAAAAGGVILLVGGGVALRAASLAPGPAVVLPTPAPSGPGAPGTAPTPGAEVVVDVVGAVAAPGVVRLPEGSRVVDALAAAGGATADAQVSALNLARLLVDGEQIAVPVPGEQVQGAAGPDDGAGGLVDLNTADAATLDALPGIGPVLADRIIAHREDGRFATVDELADVAGIGPTLLERLRDLVRV